MYLHELAILLKPGVRASISLVRASRHHGSVAKAVAGDVPRPISALVIIQRIQSAGVKYI